MLRFFKRFRFDAVMAGIVLTGFTFGLESAGAEPEPHPLTAEERAKIATDNLDVVRAMTARLDNTPTDIEAVSRRGDAHFFLGQFDQAVADYEQMVVLDPRLETSHWRRGIAYFYAGKYEQAARQFERYHSFDDVDRENGIWRFFSQVKAYDLDRARQGLLKYKKDDRQPFPDVYRLFADQTTGSEILKSINAAEITAAERETRLFYAELYVGLNDAIVASQKESARKHLRQAVANRWGRNAGFGPNYMWHVGRLHYERLVNEK